MDTELIKEYAVGRTYSQVMEHFNLTYSQTQKICAGLCAVGRPDRTLRCLADLMNTSDSGIIIANRHGVSRQRVHQILKSAQQAGIKVRTNDN